MDKMIENINNYNIDSFNRIEIHQHAFSSIDSYFNYIIDKYLIDGFFVESGVCYDNDYNETIINVWLTEERVDSSKNAEILIFDIKIRGDVFEMGGAVLGFKIDNNLENSLCKKLLDRYKYLLRMYKLNKLIEI